MNLKNCLWNNPLAGGSVIIVEAAGNKFSRKRILSLWTRSMLSSGILGRNMILRTGVGTRDTDMSYIEEVAQRTKAGMENMGMSTEGLYTPIATVCKTLDMDWPSLGWKPKAIGVVESLVTAVRLLARHPQDYPTGKPMPAKEFRVVIDGFGRISSAIIAELSSRHYRDQLKDVGLEVKIVGICDKARGIYSDTGLDLSLLHAACTGNFNLEDCFTKLCHLIGQPQRTFILSRRSAYHSLQE
jgi:hypothetical protein